MAEAVYLFCMLTSLACAALLLRNYWRTRVPLILWTSVCFAALAINNVLLFVDLALLPESIDLRLWRMTAGLIGLVVLLYGMIGGPRREGSS